MYELVAVHAVIQVVDGQAVSSEITETPICTLSSGESLFALKIGPAAYVAKRNSVRKVIEDRRNAEAQEALTGT